MSGEPYASVGWGGAFLSGYGARPLPGLATYLACLLDPVLMAARAYALNPIRVGRWRIAARGDAPSGARDFIERTTRPLVQAYVNDALWAVDLGWAPFQNVFERRDGRYVITRILPARQEWSAVLVSPETGDAVGVRWDGVDLLGHKAFFYTHDARGRSYIGRSRLENVIGAVWDWREDNDRAATLGKKACGIVAGIGYPPGKGVDAAGQPVPRQRQADAMGAIITSGAGYFTFPTLASIPEDKLRTMPVPDLIAMAKASMWQVQLHDLGDTGPAMAGLTARQRYLDELKCLGYYVPPEAVLQGPGGNRAKAAAHGDVGTAMQEPVNAAVADAFNRGPVDSLLELNFGGASARGAVWWEPEPLVDAQEAFDKALIQAVMAGTGGLSDYLGRHFDLDTIMERNGVARRATPLTPQEMPRRSPP